MKLPLLPQDKANHFVYGFVIFLLFNLFLNNIAALCVVILIASIKELYDSRHSGNVELLDIFATIIPGIFLTLIKLIH